MEVSRHLLFLDEVVGMSIFVVAASALKHKVPPVFVVDGKNIMSGWLLLLDEKRYLHLDGTTHRFSRPIWHCGDSMIVTF